MAQNNKFKIGDKVTFDADKVEEFKAHTTSTIDYRNEVLKKADQIGEVIDLGFKTVKVRYFHAELVIPVDYLVNVNF